MMNWCITASFNILIWRMPNFSLPGGHNSHDLFHSEYPYPGWHPKTNVLQFNTVTEKESGHDFDNSWYKQDTCLLFAN